MRRWLVRADKDPGRELHSLDDPSPRLGRLVALTEHPDRSVLYLVWTTIARVPTSHPTPSPTPPRLRPELGNQSSSAASGGRVDVREHPRSLPMAQRLQVGRPGTRLQAATTSADRHVRMLFAKAGARRLPGCEACKVGSGRPAQVRGVARIRPRTSTATAAGYSGSDSSPSSIGRQTTGSTVPSISVIVAPDSAGAGSRRPV